MSEVDTPVLTLIQNELKAPKSQHNKFGKYNYRTCEDILEALKPLLKKYICVLTITDSIEMIGDRLYVKATCVLTSGDGATMVSAFARESQDKKGMDAAQITGAASSYARKYALNGLFLIDDTKDADSQAPVKPAEKKTLKAPDNPEKNSYFDTWTKWIDYGFKNGWSQKEIKDHIKLAEGNQAVKDYYNKKLQESKK